MSLRRTNLPALRAPFDTNHEYNAISVASPRGVQEIVSVPLGNDIPARIDHLEDRISVQERNTQVILIVII